MTDHEIPEPDKVLGALHPRETSQLIGQDHAEQGFLDAFNSGRLHHAWLITGPQGVGKATLAWRIARFLLATPLDDGGMFGEPSPATSLDISPQHPVAQRLMALSEPRFFLLRRPYDEKTERLRGEITVDEVRRLKNFFALSAADGGRRVVVVDAADELNVNAANALLKLLEEPPEDTVLLLVCHQPSRLLPTIISRCRTLRCNTLSPDQVARVLEQSDVSIPDAAGAIGELSGGSAGAALRLISLDGLGIYDDIIRIFAAGTDKHQALKLANSAVGRVNAYRLSFMLDLFDIFLGRLARSGVTGPPAIEAAPNERKTLAALCPDVTAAQKWASLAQTLGQRARHAHAVNLDPAALILDIVLKIQETAAEMPRNHGAPTDH